MRLRYLSAGLAPAAAYLLSRQESLISSGIQQANCSGDGALDGAQLRLVQVVFRHGARTPLTPDYWAGANWLQDKDCGQVYEAVTLSLRSASGGQPPLSEHNAKQVQTRLPGGCSKGQLTRVGQQQARAVGTWLRNRYVDEFGFLDPEYQESTVSGRTTNYARTIGTLRGLLTGVYPDADAVPIVTAGDEDEFLYGNVKACKRLGTVFKARMVAAREHMRNDAALGVLQSQVRTAMGLPDGHAVAFVELHDALTCLRFHGKHLAAGLTDDLLKAIEMEASIRMMAAIAPSTHEQDAQEALRLGIGRLVAELADNMTAAQQGRPGPKLQLYSAHDTTIMPLLQILHHDSREWPPYVAHLVFELWQKPANRSWWGGSTPGEPVVRVLYNGQPLALPGQSQGTVMPLPAFLSDVFLPYKLNAAEADTECQEQPPPAAAPQPAPQGQKASGDALQGL